MRVKVKNKKNLKNFRKQLKERRVKFTYRKKNGLIRKAEGTINVKEIPKNKLPKKSKKTTKRHGNQNLQVYYDFVKNDWRSFKLDRLIDFEKEK